MINHARFFFIQRDNNPLRKEAFTASFLGKLHPARLPHLQRGSCCLARLLRASLAELPVSGNVLLIGLTESGIVPSFLMYLEACQLNIPCRWICSTRRLGESGVVFEETHSHSPNHTLPIPEASFSEVWIVEDEITTGRTIQNLLHQLQDHVAAQIFRIFSLVDFRSAQQQQGFLSLLDDQTTTYLFHTAVHLSDMQGDSADYPDDLAEKSTYSSGYPEYLLPKLAPSCGLRWNQIPPESADATLFVLGEAVHTAVLLVAAGKFRDFQHITLSPWLVDACSIRSRIDLPGKHYLYNTTKQELRSPVFLLHDPADQAMSSKVHRELEGQGIPVQQLHLL
ncbi:MAG: phosphoribosyltransferase domain-containing protein [Candidatus Electrothrix sp. YB6]